MEVELKKLIKKPFNNDLLEYIDLNSSKVNFEVQSENIINQQNETFVFPRFYSGSIIKATFQLFFQDTLPPNSSFFMFSAHSATKSFPPIKNTYTLQKVYEWIKKKSKKLWYHYILQRPLEYEIINVSEHFSSNIKVDNNNNGYINGIKSSVQSKEVRHINSSSKKLSEDLTNHSVKIFIIKDSKRTQRLSLYLDSNGFNTLLPDADTFWFSLSLINEKFYSPIALKLPSSILSNMIYLITEPSYLLINLNEAKDTEEIIKTIEISRIDKKSVSILPNSNEKLEFVNTENLSNRIVKITIHIKLIKKYLDNRKNMEIFLIKFVDDKSGGKLEISVPLFISYK